MCAAGCTNIIVPPAEVDDPQTAYVLDYGRHSSLLLPNDEETEFTEYAYGEWEWYALRRDSFFRVLPVLFLPTTGTLGRNTWLTLDDFDSTQRNDDAIREIMIRAINDQLAPEAIHPLRVEREAVARLREALNERFRKNIEAVRASSSSDESPEDEPTLWVPEYRLTFVRDGVSYTAFHNCNHEVVGWVRELDCRVRGSGMFAEFGVEPPEPLSSEEERHRDETDESNKLDESPE